MKKLFFIFILFIPSLYALDIKVASYNVENLFDLNYDRTEYKEYIPNTKKWNQKSYEIKLQNISKVIIEINADIIALQEIESLQALKDLKEKSKIYKYHKFSKKRKSAIGLAILSKYPISNHKNIIVNKYNDYERNILKVSININSKKLIIYNNHWRSKREKESKRIPYASALIRDIKSLDIDEDYIILGDLNSNYDEFISFKYDKKLNDTFGITGINHILNTSIKNNNLNLKKFLDLDTLVHYNLWQELKNKNRFSSKYRGNSNTPDNIILSKALFDNKNISYKLNSFQVFKPNYLYESSKIKRWNSHKISGFSDHLPIYATFSTNKQFLKKIKTTDLDKNNISYLYTIDNLSEDILLKNIIVIYKYKNNLIIKQKNNRAILVYKASNKLEIGNIYDIKVSKIDSYFNLKEIKKISNIKHIKTIKNPLNHYYIDAKSIDIFDDKYQNEIVKNLSGKYNKGYLYFNYQNKSFKIKLYFPKNFSKPENGTNITINAGHLSKYKSQTQIVIHQKNDYE